MKALTKKLALSTTGGATALVLLSGSPVTAGDDTFRATGRPEVTNAYVGPDGPTRFTNRVRISFDMKTPGTPRKVIRLRHPGGVATATFELAPGDSFPWHVHPGPVLVSVIDGGELSYVRGRDCVVRPYAAGSVFLEPGPEVHTAFNQGTETITLVGTFFDVGPGEALATPASDARQLRLDDRCGLVTTWP